MCRSEVSAELLGPASGADRRLLQEETRSTNRALQKRRRRCIVEQQVDDNKLTIMSSRCLAELGSIVFPTNNATKWIPNNDALKRCPKSIQCDLRRRRICASNSLKRCYSNCCCCRCYSSCCCYSNHHNAFNIGRNVTNVKGAVGYREADGGFNTIKDPLDRDVDENDYWLTSNNSNTKTQQHKIKTVGRRRGRQRSKHLALANVLIMFPIFIFLSEIIPCDSSSLSATSLVEDSITPKPMSHIPHERRQSFRQRPQPILETTQGQSILLNCEVDDQEGPVQWIKQPGIYIFHNNRTRANNHSDFDHFTIADTVEGDYSLKIEKVRLSDSGYYECQVPGKRDDGHELQAGSELRVIPLPPPTPMPVAETNHVVSNSSVSNNELNMLARSAPSEPGSLQYSRNAPVGKALNHFPSSNFISPHASNAHPTAASTIGPSNAHLYASWPYLLLLIAGLLMLANVYLVYSLFKRHQRKKDNSLESASSGSAGTGSSRVETTEQPNSSPLEFYPSSPSVLVTSSGASSSGGYNNMSAAAAAAACGGITGPNGPTYQPNAGYAAPIMHGIYQLPGSWVLEC